MPRPGEGWTSSIAITAVSAVLAVIIPPSIPTIGGPDLDLDRRALSRGVVPGLLIAARRWQRCVYAVRRGYPTYPRETFRQLLCSIWVSIPALMTPVIIVGGILLGWFTATESACVAVLCSAVLSMVAYREMNLKGLYNALVDTGRLAVALFCVGTASAFGWLLAYRIPQERNDVKSWVWGRSASASSSPSCSWWSAASSMPSRPSSSSARSCSRSPCRST